MKKTSKVEEFQNELVEEMRRLALLAGQEIMKIYNLENFSVKQKKDLSPVTEADEIADDIISSGLHKKFPEIALITEEQASSHAKDHRTFLIVDPLDGTKEFVNRRGEFTVNICYVESGIPKLGIVYAPALGKIYYTESTSEAIEEIAPFDEKKIGQRRKLKVAQSDNNALVVVASKSHRDSATDEYISSYEVASLKSVGSSLKFCLLATGEADLYPRLGRTMEWDTAAGDALLRAAGGHVVYFESLKPLMYGKRNYENPYFIAYSANVVLKRSP